MQNIRPTVVLVGSTLGGVVVLLYQNNMPTACLLCIPTLMFGIAHGMRAIGQLIARTRI